jgi:hypothetical protein
MGEAGEVINILFFYSPPASLLPLLFFPVSPHPTPLLIHLFQGSTFMCGENGAATAPNTALASMTIPTKANNLQQEGGSI